MSENGVYPNYSHLVGIMIINQTGCKGTLFSDKPNSHHVFPCFSINWNPEVLLNLEEMALQFTWPWSPLAPWNRWFTYENRDFPWQTVLALDLKMLGIYIPNDSQPFKNGIMISKTRLGLGVHNIFRHTQLSGGFSLQLKETSPPFLKGFRSSQGLAIQEKRSLKRRHSQNHHSWEFVTTFGRRRCL